MASLSLKHIFKVYEDGVKAVNDFSMDIADREFIVFVGPSGCGKSTTLRMIAGLEDITAGELRIDGTVVNDTEPRDRNIAMVFQNYALYPHMTVYENMAFSLRTAHVPKDEIHRKVTEAAEILGITEYLSRKPKALSGGQRQRVALGRAIVRNPKVFLLDEPRSNLDAKLRAAMRAEITLLHERLQTTFIYVTHDQVEAMTMGTRIVVMRGGRIQQIDTPMRLYHYPDNLFVAGFIGTPQMNFFDATLKKEGERVEVYLTCGAHFSLSTMQLATMSGRYMDGRHPVVLGLRPDALRLMEDGDERTADSVTLDATVRVIERLGGETLLFCELLGQEKGGAAGDEAAAKGRITVRAGSDCMVERGERVTLCFDAQKLHVFDRETEQNLRPRVPRAARLRCRVTEKTLEIGKNTLSLPPILCGHSAEQAELILPSDALRLGTGEGRAEIVRVDEVEGETLYILQSDDAILFCVSKQPKRYEVGQTVAFSVDFRKIAIAECGIASLPEQNILSCRLVRRKKQGSREMEFFFLIGENDRIAAPRALCDRLFACKGGEAFHTSLALRFPVVDVRVCEPGENTLNGEVIGQWNYGEAEYVRIQIGKESILMQGNIPVGQRVALTIDPDGMALLDQDLDIILA